MKRIPRRVKNSRPRHTPTKQPAPAGKYEAAMVATLSQRFPIANWGELRYDSNGLGGLLCIDDAEADLMLDLGIFGAAKRTDYGARSIEASAVLHFLETYGAEWYRVRLEKQLTDLRRQVRRTEWLARGGVEIEALERAQFAASVVLEKAEKEAAKLLP